LVSLSSAALKFALPFSDGPGLLPIAERSASVGKPVFFCVSCGVLGEDEFVNLSKLNPNALIVKQ
jgi:hypothetical protein